MTYWHEVPQYTAGWRFLPQTGGRVTVLFRGRDVRKAPFEGRFLRYEGSETDAKGRFPHWRRSPKDWFELIPHEPLLASSWGVTYATDKEGQQLSTMADDLVSAEAIAISELSQLVTRDPEIKRREAAC